MSYPVVHFDIGCKSLAKSRRFYTDVFGWHDAEYGDNSATLSTQWKFGIDGMTTALGHQPEQYSMIYVEVGNIPQMLKKVVAAGGEVVIPEVPIPELGAFAWIKDPHENLVGLWRSEIKTEQAPDKAPELWQALLAQAGLWEGSKRVVDEGGTFDFTSDLQMRICPTMQAHMLLIDFQWAYKGKPQQSHLRLMWDSQKSQITGDWVDTWHMHNAIMRLEQGELDDASVCLMGHYAAPPGPDWGWNIKLSVEDGFSILMENIPPDGKPEDAVIIKLQRLT